MTEESNEVVTPEVVTEEQPTEPMSGELEQATAEQPDSKSQPLFNEDQQRIFNNKMAEEKRRRRELEDQLKEAQSKIPQEVAPTVDKLPDRYDFDTDEQYAAAIARRDEQLRQVAQHEARQNFLQQQQQQLAQQQEAQRQAQLAETANNFGVNAKKIGIDDIELNTLIQQANNLGMTPDIGQYIMGLDNGPLVTKYLATNPVEMDRILSMNPMQAAVAISNEISEKAQSLKPTVSSAPPPPELNTGVGVPASNELGPQGAVFK